MYESVAKSGPFTTRALVCSIVFHVGLLGFFWIMGMIVTRKPDVIIPIDMTVVPPWAEQTDDPNPDPNPPPPKQEELPKPTPPPPEVKPPDPKVEAVEKFVEKPEPPKPESMHGVKSTTDGSSSFKKRDGANGRILPWKKRRSA